jgi:hypothetical protein
MTLALNPSRTVDVSASVTVSEASKGPLRVVSARYWLKSTVMLDIG